ncbi:hypothetical protein [Thermoflexus sp.]|uniref:hypothetical protein n=1 Tax=Thermoflexus sp. TaxID=1969742 RepID=UPI0035E41D79
MDPVTPESLRRAIAQADGFLWLDLCPPEETDRERLREALEEAFRDWERPKLDVYPDHYFVVFSSGSM